MSLLTKWNPFREVEEGRDWPSFAHSNPLREMERMRQQMESFFGRPALRSNGGREETMTSTQWAPLVDIESAKRQRDSAWFRKNGPSA